ncbi:hypothetical protein D3C73_1284230 [compost metagenome]
MHHLFAGNAELLVGVVEQLRIGLVGAGLLGGNDAVNKTTKLCHVTGNDVVIGIGHDAQFEAHLLELRKGRDHFGKRRHPRDRPGQALTVFRHARQTQFLQRQAQTKRAQLAERTMRRNLFQVMFVPVIHLDQALGIHGMLALVTQNVGHHSFQAFVPLNQGAVAIEGQPFGAPSIFECHRSIL